MRHAQHAGIVEAMADDLQADRQAAGVIAAADRGGRLFRHVERRGEADMAEGLRRIVARAGFLGRVSRYRRGRRQPEIVGLGRSAESLVGTECGSTCSTRWWAEP